MENLNKVTLSQFDKCVCGHRRLHHFRRVPMNPLSECKKCKCLKFKIAWLNLDKKPIASEQSLIICRNIYSARMNFSYKDLLKSKFSHPNTQYSIKSLWTRLKIYLSYRKWLQFVIEAQFVALTPYENFVFALKAKESKRHVECYGGYFIELVRTNYL